MPPSNSALDRLICVPKDRPGSPGIRSRGQVKVVTFLVGFLVGTELWALRPKLARQQAPEGLDGDLVSERSESGGTAKLGSPS